MNEDINRMNQLRFLEQQSHTLRENNFLPEEDNNRLLAQIGLLAAETPNSDIYVLNFLKSLRAIHFYKRSIDTK